MLTRNHPRARAARLSAYEQEIRQKSIDIDGMRRLIEEHGINRVLPEPPLIPLSVLIHDLCDMRNVCPDVLTAFLIDRKIDFNYDNYLIEAFKSEDYELCGIYLSAGANVYSCDEKGQDMMQFIRRQKDMTSHNLIEFLVGNGFDIRRVKDNYWYLHMAVLQGDLECVKLLCEGAHAYCQLFYSLTKWDQHVYGVQRSCLKMTPLQLAVHYEKWDIAVYLECQEIIAHLCVLTAPRVIQRIGPRHMKKIPNELIRFICEMLWFGPLESKVKRQRYGE